MSSRPVLIKQTWKRVNGKMFPIVHSQEHYLAEIQPVKREDWFKYIQNGWLSVNNDVRKWLDENGFEHIKKDENEQ